MNKKQYTVYEYSDGARYFTGYKAHSQKDNTKGFSCTLDKI